MGATHARTTIVAPAADAVLRRAAARSGSAQGRLDPLLVLVLTVLAGGALLVGTPAADVLRNGQLLGLLDAMDAMCGLFCAILLHARHLRTGRLQDLLLAQALLLGGIGGLGGAVARAVVPVVPPLLTWALLAVRLVSCVLVLAAANERARVASRSRSAWRTAGIPILIVSALGVSAAVLGRLVPNSAHLDFGAVTVLTAGAMVSMLLAAAVAFALEARRRGEELLRWLGPAFLLMGLSRFLVLLEPTLEVDRVGTVDVLRTACFVLLLAGCAADSRAALRDRERLLLKEDRRRTARDLHDGVVQELVLIRMHAEDVPGRVRDVLASAADRALDEARSAVRALAQDAEQPLDLALLALTRELGHRLEVRVDTDFDADVDARGAEQHALLRIVGEAIANAARHGRAERVQVRTARAADLRVLSVADDGIGFDVHAVREHELGFGLVAMRDRAEALRAALEIESDERGTTVTVRW